MSVTGFRTIDSIEKYDYNELDNRPSINEVILEGDVSSEDLNLLTKEQI